MPPSISPLNKSTPTPVAQSKKPLWQQLLDALDEKRPIERLEKQGGVILSREYDTQKKYAVWTKIYQSAKGNNLSVFNEWEFELLSRATNYSVQGCYKSAELIKSGSPIHTGDTPIQFRQSRQTLISTVHGGADLADWARMRLRVNRQPVPHPFAEPANYLRLARGALEALHHLHSHDFIHCDLNPGNLVLPSLIEGQNAENKTVELRSVHLEKVKITPLWDKMILIDLGYSLSRRMEPYTTLPLDTSARNNPRMSTHLRQRLDAIEQQTKDYLSSTKSHKTWEDVRYDKTFWIQWKESPLALLQKLDWREDLHQLGFLLKDIRDTWGGGEHIKLSNPILSKFIHRLPERLLAWGDLDQLDQTVPEEMPHLKLISEIEYALAQAQDKDRQDTFFLYRADNDPDYVPFQKTAVDRTQHWMRHWPDTMALRHKLTGVIQNTWAYFSNHPPLLKLLTFSYPAFVLLAVIMAKAPMDLPLGATAALVILIVLGMVVWKYTGALTRGVARCFIVAHSQYRRMSNGLGVRLKMYWGNMMTLVNKLLLLILKVHAYLRYKHPFLCMTIYTNLLFLGLLVPLAPNNQKHPIFVSLGAGIALPMLVVMMLATIKLAHLLAAGAFRLYYSQRLFWWRQWYSAIIFWGKLVSFIKTTWDNFASNHPYIGSIVYIFGSIALLFSVFFLIFAGSTFLGVNADILILGHYAHPGPISTIKDLIETSLILAVMTVSGLLAWLYCILPLMRGLKTLNLRASFRSRKIYPILLPIFLVSLAWTAENRYDLLAQANKTYEAWHQALDYAEASQKIELGGWWKGYRDANPKESAWLQTTRQLSELGWPQAMFMAALTRCYGMQNGRTAILPPSEYNLADCGPLLAAALQQGAQRWHVLGNSSGWSAMLEDTVGVLDSTLYYTKPPTGSFIRFAQALTPGLEAAAPYSDNLAYTLADIQACWLKPSQHNSAVRTLQALIERFPDSELAKRAGEHLPGLELFCEPL